MKKVIFSTIIILAFPVSALSQLPKSALNYMLQKPKVLKTFNDSSRLNRIFVDFGVGPTFALGASQGKYLSVKSPSVMGTLMVGDWITPEHGVRLGITAGEYKRDGSNNKFIGASLDYIMNITALSQPRYDVRRTFELYGIAGGELLYSRKAGENTHALGAHLGLQGNIRIDDCLHFFVEPRIGLYQDKLFHIDTWRGYRPAASVIAGFGYGLNTGIMRSHEPSPYDDFLDGLFVSSAVGGGAFLHSSLSESKHFAGIKGAVSIGKWFDPYSAVRLSADVYSFKRYSLKRMKGVSGQIDYLFNLSNIFGGYLPDRIFEFNGVAGLNLNYTNSYLTDNSSHFEFSPGIGGGVQANLFLNRHHNFAFFLEPRIDINQNKFIQDYKSVKKLDITATMMAGLTLYRAPSSITVRELNAGYPDVGWYDHLFVEAGAGVQSLMLGDALSHPRSYVGPAAYLGVGKWLNPISGVRLTGIGGKYKEGNSNWKNYASLGVDYIWNISNTFIGYLPDRKVEFLSSLGINIADRSQSNSIFFGAGASVEMLWHLNKMYALFVKPQFSIYDDHFADGWIRKFHNDGMMSFFAALHIDMGGYVQSDYDKAFDQFLRKSYFSYSGGVGFKVFHPKNSDFRAPIGRLSIGRWTNPLTGWRLSMSASAWKNGTKHYARGSVSGDYLIDLSTLAMGFQPDRAITLRALGGVDLSLDYHLKKTFFTPSLHIGGQFAVRLTPVTEIFLEPQIGYDLMHLQKSDDYKFDGKLFVGVTHSLKDHSTSSRASEKEENPNFVTIGGGMGLYSETATSNHPIHRKWDFDINVAYGHWINNVSGVRVGFTDEIVQKMHANNKQILSLHADYMVNITTLLNRGQASDNTLNVIGNIGVSGNSCAQEGSKPRLAPGLVGSLQADIRVSDNVSLFVEPTLNVMGKNIRKDSPNQYEVSGRIDVGTKIKF